VFISESVVIMASTLVWAGVVFVLALIVLWRVDVHLRVVRRSVEIAEGEREVALMERRTAAEIAQRTIDASVKLREAELERQTAEAKLMTARADELQEDHLTAARAVIEAQRDAECALAPELAKKKGPQVETAADLVRAYDAYLIACGENAIGASDFAHFTAALPEK
jgi:hypothetical protein